MDYFDLHPTITNCSLGYKMAAMKFRLHRFEKVTILATYFPKSVVLDTNRLEQRSGPTYVGPDLDS